MNSIKLRIWYAVDGDGAIAIFPEHPVRDHMLSQWYPSEMNIPHEDFKKFHYAWLQILNKYNKQLCIPEITWWDDPIKLELQFSVNFIYDNEDYYNSCEFEYKSII